MLTRAKNTEVLRHQNVCRDVSIVVAVGSFLRIIQDASWAVEYVKNVISVRRAQILAKALGLEYR